MNPILVAAALLAAASSPRAQLAIDASFVADTELVAQAYFWFSNNEQRLPRGTDLTPGQVLVAALLALPFLVGKAVSVHRFAVPSDARGTFTFQALALGGQEPLQLAASRALDGVCGQAR
jgi:hypothetical protein